MQFTQKYELKISQVSRNFVNTNQIKAKYYKVRLTFYTFGL